MRRRAVKSWLRVASGTGWRALTIQSAFPCLRSVCEAAGGPDFIIVRRESIRAVRLIAVHPGARVQPSECVHTLGRAIDLSHPRRDAAKIWQIFISRTGRSWCVHGHRPRHMRCNPLDELLETDFATVAIEAHEICHRYHPRRLRSGDDVIQPKRTVDADEILTADLRTIRVQLERRGAPHVCAGLAWSWKHSAWRVSSSTHGRRARTAARMKTRLTAGRAPSWDLAQCP
eukprot:3163549-Prymnesium_polylepis.2